MTRADITATLRDVLASRTPQTVNIPGFRAAAVLAPLLVPEGLELLFTVRSSALPHHAGQIAFPGGALDPGETVEEAARRETLEEIGLEVSADALVGRLDDQPSPAKFIVTPVVAVLDWPRPLTYGPEVSEVFTVPMSRLLGIVPESRESGLEEYRRHITFYPYQERLIWGLTGNILRDLLELVGSAVAPRA